jgi:hypothetical protein
MALQTSCTEIACMQAPWPSGWRQVFIFELKFVMQGLHSKVP